MLLRAVVKPIVSILESALRSCGKRIDEGITYVTGHSASYLGLGTGLPHQNIKTHGFPIDVFFKSGYIARNTFVVKFVRAASKTRKSGIKCEMNVPFSHFPHWVPREADINLSGT